MTDNNDGLPPFEADKFKRNKELLLEDAGLNELFKHLLNPKTYTDEGAEQCEKESKELELRRQKTAERQAAWNAEEAERGSGLTWRIWDGLPEDGDQGLAEQRKGAVELSEFLNVPKRNMTALQKLFLSSHNTISFESPDRTQRCWAVWYFYQRYKERLDKKTINPIGTALASHFKDKYSPDCDYSYSDYERQKALKVTRKAYLVSYHQDKNYMKNGNAFCFETYVKEALHSLSLIDHKEGEPLPDHLKNFPVNEAQQLEAAGLTQADVKNINKLIEDFIDRQYIE